MNPETKALVVGGGGREQALAYYTALSPQVDRVIVLPGNAGTEFLSRRVSKPIENKALPGDSIGPVIDTVREIKPELVLVGPEAWLEKGLGDALREEGVAAIAPTSAMAFLETDKAWTRFKCDEWGVPQPEFVVFTDPRVALSYIDGYPHQEAVVKVAGLAAGKGVTVCDTKAQMRQAVNEAKPKFGKAAERILIEERLFGTEVSYIVLCDGKSIIPFVPAMDHKRLLDGDQGPNTGGIGVVAPNPAVTPGIAEKITTRIIRPVIEGMSREGRGYVGFLYAGVMLVHGEPYLLEINARGGDPETQVQLPLLDQDLYQLFQHAVTGTLDRLHVKNREGACALVVVAAPGYPDKPMSGEVIRGLDRVYDPDVHIFHAGTRKVDGQILTAGGRVLGVTAVAPTLQSALEKAYAHIGPQAVNFSDMHYRKDIGQVALQLVTHGSHD